MLKMFLAAMACSATCIQAMSLFFGRQKALKLVAADEYTTVFTRGVIAVALGGAILGFGMQLSGSCPGTVWVQAGANAPGFVAVYAGGLAGALAFSIFYKQIERSGVLTAGKSFLEKNPSLPNKGYTGFLVAGALVAVIVAADYLSPQKPTELTVSAASNIFTRVMWHPAIAGIIVGLLQIPSALILRELIGSSQHYVTIVSKVAPSNNNNYLKKYAAGLVNHQQVLYGAAAVLGSMTSWMLSHGFSFSLFMSQSGSFSLSSTLESFFGGFLLVFGARLASGCTSGHGISGGGSLASGSFIAVAGMFGGAIALAVVRAIIG